MIYFGEHGVAGLSVKAVWDGVVVARGPLRQECVCACVCVSVSLQFNGEFIEW